MAPKINPEQIQKVMNEARPPLTIPDYPKSSEFSERAKAINYKTDFPTLYSTATGESVRINQKVFCRFHADGKNPNFHIYEDHGTCFSDKCRAYMIRLDSVEFVHLWKYPREPHRWRALEECERVVGIVSPKKEESKAVSDETSRKAPQVDVGVLQETIKGCYPTLWEPLEACLSAIAALRLKDLTHPVALNLVADPSSGKSLIVSWLAANKNHVYRTDHFTPKAIVSHAANIKEKDRARIHMLPKIKDKVVTVSELAPMFRGRADDIRDNCIRLIRLLDGEGFVSDSGSAGRQGFEGEYLFVWIGCTTPLEYKIWDIFGQLGPRLWFHSVPKNKNSAEERYKITRDELTDQAKKQKCKEAVSEFLNQLLDGGRYDTPWDIKKDPPEVCITIQKFADLVAICRGLVRVAYDGRESQLEHSSPIIEAPYRAYNVLESIARGHAILNSRYQLSEDDLPVVKRIVMATMPDDRRLILPKLIENSGGLDTNQVTEVLKCSRVKALICMEALRIIELVEVVEEFGDLPNKMILKDEFSWLLTDEFLGI